MSITASKNQRFGVTHNNRLLYVNAANEGEALAKARTRLITEQSSKPGVTPDEDLATIERFTAVARVKLSVRY